MRDHIEDILASDLLERYVLGDVSPQEKMKVDLLRLEHRSIREHLNQLEIALEKTAVANAIEAPAKTKECIIRKINEHIPSDTIPAQSSVSGNAGILWKYAAVMIMGGLGMWLFMQGRLQKLSNEHEALSVNYERLESVCDQLNVQYAFLNDATTLPILLEGTAQAPESQVVVYWNEMKGQSMLKVINLPSIKEDQTYQLWADVEGQMLSLGTFDAGLAIVDPIPMKYLANAESLNITIEPEGGSKHPTVSTLTASRAI